MSSQNSDHLSRRSTKICSSDDGVLNLHPQQKDSVPVTSGTVFQGPPTHAETRRKKSEVVETPPTLSERWDLDDKAGKEDLQVS